MKLRSIDELIGKTLKCIGRSAKYSEDELVFTTVDGERYLLWHDQDCCESVYLEDVVGDLADLVGSPILKASEDTNQDDPGPKDPKYDDNSHTWTFYNIATAKGHVTLRWYGSSNGPYSESVDFCKISKEYDTFDEAKLAEKAMGLDYYTPVWGTKETGFVIYY